MISKKMLSNLLLLSPFIFTFAFALDVYLPSIPNIHTYFSTTPVIVQLTISLYLLMTGIGQLLIGPLSDSVGRRWIIISGTLVFLLGSITAALSVNIEMLIIARAIQGLGSCAMMVATFAVVRDLYSSDECARMYSFLNATIALSPLLAPIVGGYLAEWEGWRSSFVFLAIMAFLVALLGFFKVKETLTKENKAKLTRKVFSNYAQIIKDRTFRMYVFCASAGFACFLTFFSVSSYIIIKLLGVPEEHFGFYFASIAVVFFIGSLISGYSSKKIGAYKTVLIGTLFISLSGIIMLLWYLLFGLSIAAFIAPMMIMGIGGAMVMGGGAGGAIEPFPTMAGAASAVFGFCEFVFAFVVSSIVLGWKVTNTVPLALTLMVLGVSAFLFCIAFYHKRAH